MKPLNSLFLKKYKKTIKNSQIKIVSFDIFDTLVMRKVENPTDVFLEMGKDKYVLSLFNDPVGFKRIRIEAENKARSNSNNEEILLKEIYQTITYLSSGEVNKLIDIEIKIEKKIIFINKEIVKCIRLAHESGKKVILTSDMYLKKKQIDLIFLNKSSIKKLISDIFVSCEIGKTKSNGTMFSYLLKKYSLDAEEMLHIGDNPVFDVQRAQEKNINTLLYLPSKQYLLQKKFEQYYVKSIDQEIETYRRLSVLKNPYVNNSKKFFFDFGASIAGPLFWSFSHWLVDLSLKNNIKQINCIMREGAIFKTYLEKVLSHLKLAKEIKINLIYASRRSLFLPCLTESDLSFEKLSFSQFRHLTVLELYEMYGVYPNDKYIVSRKDVIISSSNNTGSDKDKEQLKQRIISDLSNQSHQILKKSIEKKELFRRYLKSLKLQKNSVLFDFGGNNTIPSRISDLLDVDNFFTNVLFYRTNAGLRNSVSQKQYTFIHEDAPVLYKTELFRRSPDIFEILLNGTLATTVNYYTFDNQVLPELDSHSPLLEENIWRSFTTGVDSFFQTCINYNYKPFGFDSRYILDLITRVIELPTSYEAQYLGRLPVNLTDDNKVIRSVVSQENIRTAKKTGLNIMMKNHHLNLWSYWKNFPWIQGTITSIEPGFLMNSKYFSMNSNGHAVEQLLEKIDNKKIKELSIYGVGEFLDAIYPFIKKRGIKVNYLIDSKPVKDKKFNIPILTPASAIDKGEQSILVASVAFSDEMKNTLSGLSDDIAIISYESLCYE